MLFPENYREAVDVRARIIAAWELLPAPLQEATSPLLSSTNAFTPCTTFFRELKDVPPADLHDDVRRALYAAARQIQLHSWAGLSADATIFIQDQRLADVLALFPPAPPVEEGSGSEPEGEGEEGA